jgi:hypothetical protein
MSGIEAVIENLSVLFDTIGELRTAIAGQITQARHEQLATLREHIRPGDGPNIVWLPLALAKNHRRHLGRGYARLTQILGRDQRADKPATRSRGARAEPQHRSGGK